MPNSNYTDSQYIKIGSGGEGVVYKTSDSKWCKKVYYADKDIEIDSPEESDYVNGLVTEGKIFLQHDVDTLNHVNDYEGDEQAYHKDGHLYSPYIEGEVPSREEILVFRKEIYEKKGIYLGDKNSENYKKRNDGKIFCIDPGYSYLNEKEISALSDMMGRTMGKSVGVGRKTNFMKLSELSFGNREQIEDLRNEFRQSSLKKNSEGHTAHENVFNGLKSEESINKISPERQDRDGEKPSPNKNCEEEEITFKRNNSLDLEEYLSEEPIQSNDSPQSLKISTLINKAIQGSKNQRKRELAKQIMENGASNGLSDRQVSRLLISLAAQQKNSMGRWLNFKDGTKTLKNVEKELKSVKDVDLNKSIGWTQGQKISQRGLIHFGLNGNDPQRNDNNNKKMLKRNKGKKSEFMIDNDSPMLMLDHVKLKATKNNNVTLEPR
ncbi:hypothetical protein [Cysteiniphilum litorale]|uniref:hypothetical protein n=1 Tax=Cysteiniphilum litorale TaxID=2056700 RepID=UPI003F88486C